MNQNHFCHIYRPVTARPFSRRNGTYREWEPCDALKPYIRCFWESRSSGQNQAPEKWLVIPDTCMDVIFEIDYGKNCIAAQFCGIDDVSFFSELGGEEKREKISFGIRFYPWSAVFFSEESMRNTKNGFFDAGYHFSGLKESMEPLFMDLDTSKKRIVQAENYLLKNIHPEHSSQVVLEAVSMILCRKGNLRMEELGREIHQSSRQIERLFQENMGITPKQFSSLVRYQYLWNRVLKDRDFQVLDAVFEFGYTDQSHLFHDFKRYHTMTIKEARDYAFSR